MIKFLKNSSGNVLRIPALKKKFPVDYVWQIPFAEIDIVMTSLDTLTLIREGKLQVGWSETNFFTDPVKGEAFLKDTFLGVNTVIDSTNGILEIIPGISTDTETGKKTSDVYFQVLRMLRELYNEVDNPFYKSGFETILQKISNIISTFNTIQNNVSTNTSNIVANSSNISLLQSDISKLTDPKQHLERPNDLLIYYGWLNSYNSDINGWSNEKVAQDMAKHNVLIFGDGIQDSSHGDYSNSIVIIPRIKQLNPNALIFGYVSSNQEISTFQSKVDQWESLQIDGIFMDECGYDYGTVATNGREAFNTKVDYIHGLNYAKLCFINSWNMDHIIGTENDVSYPNTIWNPSLVESNLNEKDWYLLESFAVNTLSYTDKYEEPTDWFTRGNKAINHRDFYDINLASVGVIDNTDIKALDLFNFAFTASLMFSLDAFGTSDIYYGASSAKVVMWNRPDISGMGRVWVKKPNVLEDLTDADAYIRFTDFGKLSVDFTNNSESSEIVKN